MGALFGNLGTSLGGAGGGPGAPEVTTLQRLLYMVVAGVLAALVAYRPWRYFIWHAPTTERQTADTQILVCVAGAIMVTVIGDNVARAFGLVGLGGIVRFRSGIRDTRDAALMFLMIATGMACGLGMVGLAILIAVFSAVTLTLFDYTDHGRTRRVSVRVDEPRAALVAIRESFPHARVLEAPNTRLMGPGANTVVLELNGEVMHADAADMLDLFRARGVPGVRSVTLDDD